MLIEDIYQILQKENLCDSAYDFSVRFLGKSRSYYSVIKARNEIPSIEAIVTLETTLKNTANLYSNNPHPVIKKIRHSLQGLSNDVGAFRVQRVQEKLTSDKYS